jgi:hypothetical protein
VQNLITQTTKQPVIEKIRKKRKSNDAIKSVKERAMKRMQLVTDCFGVSSRTEINPRKFCSTEVTTNMDSDGGKKKGQCSVTDLR